MTISSVMAAAVVVAGTAVGLAGPAYAEDGPFPGGTAKTLTRTVDGVSVVTDLTKKCRRQRRTPLTPRRRREAGY